MGLWKKPSLGLLCAYAFLILVETVLIRQPFAGQHFQPIPFWSWREWSVQQNQILTNASIFIPIGLFAGYLWKWKGVLVGAGLSCLVEILQLITSRGLCEFDDVFHNVVGTAVGVSAVIVISKLYRGKAE